MPNNDEIKSLTSAIQNLNALMQAQLNIPPTPGIINDFPRPVSAPELSGDIEDWQLVVFDAELLANDNVQVTQRIPLESHFDLIYLTGRAVKKQDRSYVRPDLEIKLVDSGSDKYLTKDGAWVHWQNVLGSMPEAAAPLTFLSGANAPYTIAGRRRFPAGTSITLEVRNFTANDMILQVVMHGLKVFARK